MTKKQFTIPILSLLTAGLLWVVGDFLLSNTAVIDGIKVQNTLYENLSPLRRLALRRDIKNTLSGDGQSLRSLVLFDCGGAAGCYDLGYVLTQLIYRVGENKVVEMGRSLNKRELAELESLLIAGLEYGASNNDRAKSPKEIDQEFPLLYRFLLHTKRSD